MRPPRTAPSPSTPLRILIVGSGAREHALAWRLARSPSVAAVVSAPGNAATGRLGQNLEDVDANDPAAIVAAARVAAADLVVIGPEDALAAGAADRLRAEDIACIGPGAAAAQLESSKTFGKQLLREQGIPTAGSTRVTAAEELEALLEAASGPSVVKWDGLAQGKGVLVSDDHLALRDHGRRGLEQGTLLVEEYLEGWELSQLLLMDGRDAVAFPLCADHKRAFDGDAGPNTGGMGCVCPVPAVTPALAEQIDTRIVQPTLDGLRRRGLGYPGVLFIGLMVTDDGPKVVEYNVRFGDPETEALMPLFDGDLGAALMAAARGSLDPSLLRWTAAAAAVVVVAAGGYPGSYDRGIPVRALPAEDSADGVVFHASTLAGPPHSDAAAGEEGAVSTNGGRCFAATGVASALPDAVAAAYRLAGAVQFDGAWYRRDIGRRFLDG